MMLAHQKAPKMNWSLTLMIRPSYRLGPHPNPFCPVGVPFSPRNAQSFDSDRSYDRQSQAREADQAGFSISLRPTFPLWFDDRQNQHRHRRNIAVLVLRGLLDRSKWVELMEPRYFLSVKLSRVRLPFVSLSLLFLDRMGDKRVRLVLLCLAWVDLAWGSFHTFSHLSRLRFIIGFDHWWH